MSPKAGLFHGLKRGEQGNGAVGGEDWKSDREEKLFNNKHYGFQSFIDIWPHITDGYIY